MNSKKINHILLSVVLAGLSQTAQAVYTWTTTAVPSAVVIVQGCGADAAKSFAWITVPGYSQQFSFITTTTSGGQMLETLLRAVSDKKKVALNYYGTDATEYLNQWNFRYGKGNCNLESKRFTLIHGVSVNP